jgi:hypothetical protein
VRVDISRSQFKQSVLIIITILAISCNFHGQDGDFGMVEKFKGGQDMEKDYRVNYIMGIEKDPRSNSFKITTHQSGELFLDERHLDLPLIRKAMRENKPLQIKYNVNTKQIYSATYATIDWVPYIKDPSYGVDYIEVSVLMIPSMLRLYKRNPRFNELYSRLSKAQSSYKDNAEKGRKAIIANGAYEIYDVILCE